MSWFNNSQSVKDVRFLHFEAIRIFRVSIKAVINWDPTVLHPLNVIFSSFFSLRFDKAFWYYTRLIILYFFTILLEGEKIFESRLSLQKISIGIFIINNQTWAWGGRKGTILFGHNDRIVSNDFGSIWSHGHIKLPFSLFSENLN